MRAVIASGTGGPEVLSVGEVPDPTPGPGEVLVAVADGSGINGHDWVLHGPATDLSYTVEVSDVATGARRTYDRPAGALCGAADFDAF